jgi:hypothetical protein
LTATDVVDGAEAPPCNGAVLFQGSSAQKSVGGLLVDFFESSAVIVAAVAAGGSLPRADGVEAELLADLLMVAWVLLAVLFQAEKS